MNKYAYATIATKSIYFPCIIRQQQRMNYLKCKYPFVVLITDNIPKSEIQILDDNNINYQIIPYFDYGKESIEIYYDLNNNYQADCFLKFELLKLTQYDKIMFVDADIIFVDNFDNFLNKYEIPKNHYFLFQLATDLDKEFHIPGDMFFLKPNKDMYNFIHTLLKRILKKECLDDQIFALKYLFENSTFFSKTLNHIHFGGYIKPLILTNYPFIKYLFYDCDQKTFNSLIDNLEEELKALSKKWFDFNNLSFNLGHQIGLKY